MNIYIYLFIDPIGWYSLSMSSALGRAILYELLFRISINSNIEVTHYEYLDNNTNGLPIQHSRKISGIGNQNLDNNSNNNKEKLIRKIKSIDITLLDNFEKLLIKKYEHHIEIAERLRNPGIVRDLLNVNLFIILIL